VNRREFLASAAAAAAPGEWSAGPVHHILPAATHDRFLVKVSLKQPARRAPVLSVGSRRIAGVASGTRGRFWAFDVPGLAPATRYELRLRADGASTDPWPLSTFPVPEAEPERFRLLVYTCAGGNENMTIEGIAPPYWVSIANRRKLFAQGLKRQPDAMVAIGDHVYWDLRFGRASGRLPMGSTPWAQREIGVFNRDIPVLGTPNEAILERAVSPQVADLYGTLFRSTPTHFVQDDHDYFENDEAIPAGISFPPDDFMMRLARATQHLYYPEFLPDAARPAGLPGASASDRFPGLAEAFGTLRFGRLAELLICDCRRFQTLKGPHATLIPENAEAWIRFRLKESPAAHVVQVPSMPIGWSAGKWGEWYPDLLGSNGKLSVAQPKYFWQEGWKSQHDRLLAAASATRNRIPLFISGDLHAMAHGAIEQSGRLDLRSNPVHSILAGSISTGPTMWPSAARGTPPQVASGVNIRTTLDPLENNGFTIADFHRDRIEFQQFRWKMGQPEELLDRLEPFHKFTLTRT